MDEATKTLKKLSTKKRPIHTTKTDNQEDNFLLHKAAKDGNIPELRRLIDKGVDVNGKLANGTPALQNAMNKECVTILLNAGATIHANDWLYTVLHNIAAKDQLLQDVDTTLLERLITTPGGFKALNDEKLLSFLLSNQSPKTITFIQLLLDYVATFKAPSALCELITRHLPGLAQTSTYFRNVFQKQSPSNLPENHHSRPVALTEANYRAATVANRIRLVEERRHETTHNDALAKRQSAEAIMSGKPH